MKGWLGVIYQVHGAHVRPLLGNSPPVTAPDLGVILVIRPKTRGFQHPYVYVAFRAPQSFNNLRHQAQLGSGFRCWVSGTFHLSHGVCYFNHHTHSKVEIHSPKPSELGSILLVSPQDMDLIKGFYQGP